jgi:hypothetical protein
MLLNYCGPCIGGQIPGGDEELLMHEAWLAIRPPQSTFSWLRTDCCPPPVGAFEANPFVAGRKISDAERSEHLISHRYKAARQIRRTAFESKEMIL